MKRDDLNQLMVELVNSKNINEARERLRKAQIALAGVEYTPSFRVRVSLERNPKRPQLHTPERFHLYRQLQKRAAAIGNEAQKQIEAEERAYLRKIVKKRKGAAA